MGKVLIAWDTDNQSLNGMGAKELHEVVSRVLDGRELCAIDVYCKQKPPPSKFSQIQESYPNAAIRFPVQSTRPTIQKYTDDFVIKYTTARKADYDTVILVSADKHFAALQEKLKLAGKGFEVLTTQSAANNKLSNVADRVWTKAGEKKSTPPPTGKKTKEVPKVAPAPSEKTVIKQHLIEALLAAKEPTLEGLKKLIEAESHVNKIGLSLTPEQCQRILTH